MNNKGGGIDLKKIGLLVNPIAGMGGKVGLKGTDGQVTLELAKERGAIPESPDKALKALEKLLPLKESLLFLVPSGSMGELTVQALGFNYEVIYQISQITTQKDSLEFLKQLKDYEVDLLLFAGGDGTARDVSRIIEFTFPSIGIPTGVKIHSPVYAISPEAAGELAYKFLSDAPLSVIRQEVIDIEEEAFRRDEIITKVYGYLNVPYDESHLQNLKSPSPQSDEHAQISAALQVIDDMEEDVYYIIGSGSTTQEILKELELSSTLLGVDIIKNKELIAKDVYEQQILDIIQDEPTKLVVTPMGGQGYLFGRGNQQLSDKVLEKVTKDNLIIIATPMKLDAFKKQPLLIYTGNEAVDQSISGYYRTVVGYGTYVISKVLSAKY